MSVVDDAVAALRSGRPVVLPFDTVYGLAADPGSSEPVQRLYLLKGRVETQPSALVAADLDDLLERIPELDGRSARIAQALFPGSVTAIFPNPAARFRWLTGDHPAAIGVRIPSLSGPAAEVLLTVRCLVATSANYPGEEDPRRLEDVPDGIRNGAAAIVDGGVLPGTPSTIVDFTGAEPKILRAGAVPAEEALALAAEALAV